MGSLPPSGAENSAACFGPVATRGEKRKDLGKKNEKAKMPSNSEQPLALKRKVRLEEHAGELLEDYARFIGISEVALDIVARRMTATTQIPRAGRTSGESSGGAIRFQWDTLRVQRKWRRHDPAISQF